MGYWHVNPEPTHVGDLMIDKSKNNEINSMLINSSALFGVEDKFVVQKDN